MKAPQYYAQQLAKPSDTRRAIEDRVMDKLMKPMPGRWCAGIADGAGGEGIYAGEWAQCLLDHLHQQKRVFQNAEELDTWVESFYEAFEAWVEKQTEPNSLARIKFEREGALSTLAAVWWTEDHAQLEWAVYGDSCVLRWRREAQKLEVYPPAMGEGLSGFTGTTHLIATNAPLRPEGFVRGSGMATREDCLLLATDAMSQYLVLGKLLLQDGMAPAAIEAKFDGAHHPLAGKIEELASHFYAAKDMAQWMRTILGAVQSKPVFEDLCRNLYEYDLLVPDDYSLMMIEI